MLNLMRKYATSWLIKILLGTIVFVFVLWGVGSFRSQRQGRVAVVNGETVSLDEYKAAYTGIIDQLRQQFGNNLNDELLKMFQVRQQALNQIIEKRLLLGEAKRLNLKVSDAEIAQAISRFGAFQTNGNFDRKRYENVLRLNRLSPEGFELMQRETLVIDKLRLFIEGNVRVSEAEALEWYNWRNATVDIRYVLFDPAKSPNPAVSEADIAAFYEKRKESYKTAPKVKVRYLSFKPVAYSPLVTVTDQQLKDYYDANPEAFKTPRTVEARHILFRVGQDAADETVEAARLKAADVTAKAKAGEDFAELAKKFSEGPSKDAGGYLGKFKKEDMVKPFADRAFAMKAGEVSEPVRTQFGWHVIKLEGVQPESHQTFAEARENIRKKLVEDQAKIRAYDAAEAAYNASYEGDDLSETASTQDLEIQTTDFFTRQGPSGTAIKNPAQFAEAAFKLSAKEISEIQDLDDGYYILQMIEKIPEQISPLKDVKDKLTVDLKKEKREAAAKAAAENLLAALKSGKSLEQAAAGQKLTVETSGYFKRNDAIPGIGYDQNILAAAFGLSDRKQLVDHVMKGEKGFYVIAFKDRKPADPQAFEKEKAKLREVLLQQKKRNAFTEWVAGLRKKSEITIADAYKDLN